MPKERYSELYVHLKCGKKKLIDYGGYVWCDECREIVDNPDDNTLTEEEYQKYLRRKFSQF